MDAQSAGGEEIFALLISTNPRQTNVFVGDSTFYELVAVAFPKVNVPLLFCRFA